MRRSELGGSATRLRVTAQRITVAALIASLAGCGESPDTARDGGETERDGGSVGPDGAVAAPDGGDAGGADGGAATSLIPRNASEVIVPAGLHPEGRELVAVLDLPAGATAAAPAAGCVVLHGSGGLFRERALGEPCSEEIEGNFQTLIDGLRARGVAAIAPSSFYSRDPRFCEDNSAHIDFAPAGYDRDQHRIAIRTYDLLATTRYFCALDEVDCDRLCFVGTSNGGSILFHYIHHGLDASFATFFEDDAAAIGDVPYVPIPADRPLPRFAQAISPGCGLNGAIGFEADPGQLETEDAAQLYYPADGVQLYMDLGTEDTVPDECALAVGDGRREIQAAEMERRLAIDAADSRYRFTIHTGGEHDLLGQATFGDAIRRTFFERVDAL